MGSELNVETMARINAFCKKITAPMGLDEGIYRELCSHMEDKVRAYLDGSEGINEADALLLVERHFGRQERVRALLQTANKEDAANAGARSLRGNLVFRMLSAISLACLLLLVATSMLWVRSNWALDCVGRVGQTRLVCFSSDGGSLCFSITPACPSNERPGPRPFYFHNVSWGRSHRGGMISGGKLVQFLFRFRPGSNYVIVLVPHWLVALLLSALSIPWICVSYRHWRLRRRAWGALLLAESPIGAPTG